MIFRSAGREVRWANEVIDLSWTYRVSRLVQVAHAVGVFERLAAGRATALVIARDRELDAAMVERMLPPLAALGLVRRAGGKAWQLTPKTAATLVSGAPFYQGNTLAHSGNVWSFWNDLESAVRGKRGKWRYVEGEGAGVIRSHRDFILAMHNMAMAGRAAWLAERVSVRGRHRLMDIGGGPGSYSMALCERNPGLRATVFDLAETVKIARETIGRLGMRGRVDTVVGDWDKNDFGEGNDVVLLSNIMHGADDKAEMKLAKAHRSLVPGGLLIVQDFLLNAAKTGPLIPALFNVMVGAFSLPEMVARIRGAGFSKLRARPMPANVGTTVITAEKSN